MDKLGSVVDRMNMKLGSKYFTLESQDPASKKVPVSGRADGATHPKKDGLE
jgi:hypothetical protein